MKWLQCFAVLFALCASLPGAAAATAPSVPAVQGPYLLADVETGTVYEHFDALRPWYPASTTKLMTIYVTFRAIQAGQLTLESPVVYSANAAAQPPSKMGFKPGTTLTLDNALKIMMVKSANDIAVAVAEAVGGSVTGFAERMNEEARRLGMDRSHFVNPHGLPDERQVTTARDMAVLARALLTEFPQHRDFYKIHAIRIGGKTLKNYNTLLDRYPGANGMKTGFICASGYNLVASARRGEREVIAVVFGEYGGQVRAERAASLLEEGFRAAPPDTPVDTTLANVSSGEGYTTALDMRPFVCAPEQKATASEANLDSGSALAEEFEPVSYLHPSVYMGPPIAVSVLVPPKPPKMGEPGFLARIPKPRPEHPGDAERADMMDAFAPVTDLSAKSAPAQAIGAAAGAPVPLQGINPN
jgi:D-alanyl-D-alanine carboxypeptidase